MNKKCQIAVFSIPNSDIEEWQIGIADKWGLLSEKYGFSTIVIDENKINLRIAKSIKKCGGKVLGCKFGEEIFSEPYYFDFHIRMDNQHSHILQNILNSCEGIVVIGSID